MSFIALNADAVSSSPIITAAYDVMSSSLNVSVPIDAQSNFSEVTVESLDLSSTNASISTEILDVQHWSAEKGQRYKQLTLNEAFGKLSIEELSELETLTRLRRSEKYPRTADEILWHRRQRNLTQGLVQALQTYVEFHETPHHA